MLAGASGELFHLLCPLLRDARLVGICKLIHHERWLLLSVTHRSPEKPHFKLPAMIAWFVATRAYVAQSDCLSAAAASTSPAIVTVIMTMRIRSSGTHSLRRFDRPRTIFRPSKGNIKDHPNQSQLELRQRAEPARSRLRMAMRGAACNPFSGATSPSPSPAKPPTRSPASPPTARRSRSKPPSVSPPPRNLIARCAAGHALKWPRGFHFLFAR